jgi:aminoglycoside phosphotransferase (APT) family kinase protein
MQAELPAALSAALSQALAATLGAGTQVQGLRRLSGGASQETWAFEAVAAAARAPASPRALILRRAPAGAATRANGNPGLAAEAQLIRLAGAAGVPVPDVVLVLQPAHGLGDGFVMQRLPGETLGRRIASAERNTLAWQCGAALARIHALPVADLPPLRATQPRAEVAHLRQWHAGHGAARPVFQLALRWLDQHAPADGVATLVHGDFRNGNLMVDLAAPDGVPGSALVGVLDWELAHLGDPMADLGWLCVHSWRFGQLQRPVGGFGSLDALLAGYASAGGRADRDRLHWWQVLGSLRWGVICESMGQAWRSGAEPVMEKAAISRRASETEIDLLGLLVPRP